MLKKVVMLIMLGLIFSSCYYLDVMIYNMETRYIINQATKKDGESAYFVEEYTEGVKAAIKDVAKRPLTQKVKYGELELILPENTKIKKISDNIVDKKTGYGLQIVFNKSGYCTNPGISCMGYYSKKTENSIYELIYNKDIEGLEEIAQKIIKANGFTKGCK